MTEIQAQRWTTLSEGQILAFPWNTLKESIQELKETKYYGEIIM